MACILKGFSAMLRALRRNKNRIVPAKSKTVDKIIEDTSNNSSQTKEKVPTGGICGVVANHEDMFVVQWGANTEDKENDSQIMIKPKMAAVGTSLWKVDPDTAKKLAEIKQMEAALRRKEISEKEGKRLAERHGKIKTAQVAKRTNRVVNLINDLELL